MPPLPNVELADKADEIVKELFKHVTTLENFKHLGLPILGLGILMLLILCMGPYFIKL